MPTSSASFTQRGNTNNDCLNTLTSYPSQEEYNRIYTRDSQIYADCVYDSDYIYDSDHQDISESEEDSGDDNSNYISFTLPLSEWIKAERNSKAFGLHTHERKQVKKKVNQPYIESPDLPELPVEILGLVFTYLSEATLRYSVNLVCKKWHEVSDLFICRAGIWEPIEGVNELLLSRWPRIRSLELRFNREIPHYWEPDFVTTKTAFWNAFVTAITEPRVIKNQRKIQHEDGDGDTDSSAASYLLHTIHHLEVRGLYMIYAEVASDLRGHLQFMESLTIVIRTSPEPISLFTILEDFPALRSFHLSIRWDSAALTHGDDEDKDEPADIVVDGEPKIFPERYQLQRFRIDYINTNLRVLERLIVTCPDLRVFKAKDIRIDSSTRKTGPDVDEEEINAEDRKSRQRLIGLAGKHCPKLEWYSFHTYYHASEKEDLRDIARTFPNLKMQSIDSRGDLDTVSADTLGLQELLEEITVLELSAHCWFWGTSDTLSRILCLTPNLLHLMASEMSVQTSDLWKPPEPVVKPTKEHDIVPVGNRKRRERKARRRRARELALTDLRPTAPATEGDTPVAVIDTPVAVIDPLIPVTWQVYKLKTLEFSFHHNDKMADFTDYISRYRLFGNLVALTLYNSDLKVGQLQPISKKKTPTATVASDGDAEPLLEHMRYPNELLGLRPLRCLEEFTLRVSDVPGMISSKNFKFLKRADSLPLGMNEKKRKEAMRRKNKKSALKTMTATGNNGDVDKDGEEEEEEDEEEWKDETFWPKLTTFHITYPRNSLNTNTQKLVRRLQDIRPGVAFRFQSRK